MCDGDSKTHKTLCDAKPYGQDVAIIKHECIGHIQKRMGKALHELKKTTVYGYAEDKAATKAARERFKRQHAQQQLRSQRGQGKATTAQQGKGKATSRGGGTISAPVDPAVAVPPVMVQKRLAWDGHNRLTNKVRRVHFTFSFFLLIHYLLYL